MKSCSIKSLPRHPELEAALQATGLLGHFQHMAPSHQREYIEWIMEAQKEETKQTRIKKVIEAMHSRAQGKA